MTRQDVRTNVTILMSSYWWSWIEVEENDIDTAIVGQEDDVRPLLGEYYVRPLLKNITLDSYGTNMAL